MAIRVVQIDGKTSTHKDGTKVSVNDGHLFVTDEGGQDVAVYAPGKWTSANKSVAKAGPGAHAAE
jgi:hypothetical protein